MLEAYGMDADTIHVNYIALGVLFAIMAMSPNGVMRGCAAFYIWFFRGTPLILQLLIWFNLIFFPYVVVLTPFIIYSLFQTYYIALTYLTMKPQAESNRDATGIMLTTLINASLLVWIVATGTLMLVDHPAYERLADPNKFKYNEIVNGLADE